MKIDLEINSNLCLNLKQLRKRDKRCAAEILDAFRKRNPKYDFASYKGWDTEGIPTHVTSYKIIKKNELHVSRGGYKKLKKILESFGHTIVKYDNRLTLPSVNFFSKIKLNPEQVKPIKKLKSKKRGCLRGPCGSGKTVMILEAIAQIKQPATVVVWSNIHQKHWLKEIKKFFAIRNCDIGGCGGIFKKPKLGIINVCMQQSLYNENTRKIFAENSGLLAGDEIQRYAAKTFQEVINDFPAKWRIGASANERRKDGLESLIYDTFGPVICEIHDSDISSRIKAKIKVIQTNYKIFNYFTLNNRTKLIQNICANKYRNAQILKDIRRSIKKGKLCLVYTERVDHALKLYFALEGCRRRLMIGPVSKQRLRDEKKWPKQWKDFLWDFNTSKADEKTKKLGAARKIDVIIGTQKIDVGLSIKPLEHGFITTPSATNMERFTQQKGRIERSEKNKKTPVLHYYWDSNVEKLEMAGYEIQDKYRKETTIKYLDKE